MQGDLRDYDALAEAARGARVIYHLAAQTAVTTSVREPRADFEANALGTFNALEAARDATDNATFIYASTNKVYGGLEDMGTREGQTRYEFVDAPEGIDEERPLDLHSPYGCSKGAGDQYVRDYHRIYGLPTVVMRQSCIYGRRQFGVEDQGWVAWFAIAALLGKPITIYGNGKQVRDVLWVDDLLDAYDAATSRIERAAGRIYNVGGGPEYALSVWAEFRPLLEEGLGRKISVAYADWRPGDQPIFISDVRRARRELGWQPKTGVAEGIRRLIDWIRDNRKLFEG